MDRFGEIEEKVENFLILAEKVFGPYQKKEDGRKFVIVKKDDGTSRTVSWPKWIMEKHLGKELDKDLHTVDHLDFNFDNNALDNLRILPRAEHSRQDTRRVKLIKLKCTECGCDFERSPRLLRDKSKKGCRGTFCGRQCAGKHSRKVQLGLIEKAPIQPFFQSEFFRQKNVKAFLDHLIQKFSF